MKFLLPLLAASLITLAAALSTAGTVGRAGADPADPRLDPPVPIPDRVSCSRPATLRLRRFEDGSAWLLCAGRVLVRVSVPG
jgi:hypothetical protein